MDKIRLPKNKKFIGFLAASMFIHCCLLISKTSSIDYFQSAPKEVEEIVKLKLLQNYQSKIKNQIVQTEQKVNLKKAKTAFLGKKDNSVDRETRAANTGKFKTAGVGKRDGSDVSQKAQKNLKNKKKTVSLSNLGFKTNTKEYSEKEYKRPISAARKGLANGVRGLKGLGQSNDYLEDIPLGDFTKLNTQEFEFYGFYHRIRQKLEQFWGRNIQDEADKIFKSGRSLASDTNHITALENELNENGEIVKVDIKSASGVRELDSAAIDTFNQAGPFPNPPAKMLQNGRAKIKWSFVVNT